MKINFRNANIGAAVTGVFFFVGGYLFQDSEGILAIVVLAGFACGLVVMEFLNDRDERREKRSE